MPMDGFSLSFLVNELQFLQETRIDKANQPEKDMLILGIRTGKKDVKLLISASPSMPRIHLTKEQYQNPAQASTFCMLCRKHLVGGRIKSIEQINADRIVKITVEHRDELGDSGYRELWFEGMGRHSILSLVKDGKIIDAIRHVNYDMSRVRQLLPGANYEMPPVQDKLSPFALDKEALNKRLSHAVGALDKALMGAISGLSKTSAKELASRATNMENPMMEAVEVPLVTEKIMAFYADLFAHCAPVLFENEQHERLDYFPFPYLSIQSDGYQAVESLSFAMESFYSGRDKQDRMSQKSASLKKHIKTHLERSEKKLALQLEELQNSEKAEQYRLYGELLSSQLHAVPKGAKQVSLTNYYDENNASIDVPLDETKTPAQNAQNYFKKYKKAMVAKQTAKEQQKKTVEDIELLENALQDLTNCEQVQDIADIRTALEQAGFVKRERAQKGKKKAPESKPFTYYATDGRQILVGKNSLQNERLVKNARNDDLWLHAKGVPGSHVLICAEGKPFDDQTILEGARLAAYHSKGAGNGVQVDYTLRKYVKKPNGTPLGFVIFTHNKTLVIDTTKEEIQALSVQN